MGHFYIKSDVNEYSDMYDTTISSVYSDLAEGQSATLKIKGNQVSERAVLDFPMPPMPSYGSGKLDGFTFQFHLDTSKDQNPERSFVAYKFKSGKGIDNEEGSMVRVTNSDGITEPVFASTVHLEAHDELPHSCYHENFTGESDAVVTTRTRYLQHPAITVDDALQSMSLFDKGFKALNMGGGQKAIFEDHLSIQRESQVEHMDKVVPLKRLDDNTGYKTVKTYEGKHYYFYDDISITQRLGFNTGKSVEEKVFYMKDESAKVFETDGENEVTPTSSFLDIVSVDIDHFKADAASRDASLPTAFSTSSPFVSESRIDFSDKVALTGNKAMHMYSNYEHDSKKTGANQDDYVHKSGEIFSTSFVTKKNIPMPVHSFDPSGTGGSTSENTAKSEITIDVYFDNMEVAYKLGTNGKVSHDGSTESEQNNQITHLRSFFITFSELLPQENVHLGQYVSQHFASDKDGTIDKHLETTDDANLDSDLIGVGFIAVPRGSAGASGDGGVRKAIVPVKLGQLTCGYNAADGVSKHQGTVQWGTPANGWELQERKWYRLKFCYTPIGYSDDVDDVDTDADGSAGSMIMYVTDPLDETEPLDNTQAIGGTNILKNGLKLYNINYNYDAVSTSDLETTAPNAAANWTPHMSMWLTNIREEYTSSSANSIDMFWDGAAGVSPIPGSTSEMSVYIDSIRLKNNSLKMGSLSAESNPNYLKGQKACINKNNKLIINNENTSTDGNRFRETSTGIALGFDDRTKIAGVQNFLLFNGFSSNNMSVTTGMLDADLRAGLIENNIPNRMGHIRDSYNKDSTDLLVTLTAGDGGEDIGVGNSWSASPRSDVASFSQKGLVEVSTSVNADNNNGRRECLWASAKVMSIESIDTKSIKIKVDKLTPFMVPEGIQFIMYKHSADWDTSATNWTVLDLDNYDTSANTVVLKYSSGQALSSSNSTDMGLKANIPVLWVSPYLHWLVIQTDNEGLLPERYYESVCMIESTLAATSGGDGFGFTHNESSFSQSSGDLSYNNLRNLTITSESVLDVEQDYGFGKFSDDETGYFAEFTLDRNSIDGLQTVDFSNLMFGTDKPEFDGKRGTDRIAFLLAPRKPSVHNNFMEIHSSEASTTTLRPRLFARYEDEVPVINNFKGMPNEDNPQFTNFEWETDAVDLWYGMLIVDSQQVSSQYHNAIAHIPLNEESEASTYMYFPDQGETYLSGAGASNRVTGTETSTVISRLDGLSGYCKDFDGVDDSLNYATSAMTDPTDKFTLSMHTIPNYVDSSKTRKAFFRSGFCEVNFVSSASGTHITAVLTNTNGDTYTLTSGFVYTDGKTPIHIAVQYDKTLPSKGAKLFVNGLMADSLNIDTSYNIASNNNAIYIGNDDNADDDGFNGRIEEVVLYKDCPIIVNPQSKSYTFNKPLSELNRDSGATSGAPEMHSAKLFLKDYHNIRGYSSDKVGTSSLLSLKRTAFNLARA